MNLDVERVAHGGVCVAHCPDGRVVFVRHALPGERVRVQVTEERRSYLRADAIEVLRPAPDRVTAPCRYAGPGRCGGCDWQHVTLAAQRRLKATVVAEHLQRLAGIERQVTVEAVPGDDTGLGWRTRMRFAVDEHGRAGLHRHRSGGVQPLGGCLIAAPALDAAEVLARRWPADSSVLAEVTAGGDRRVGVAPLRGAVTEHAAGRAWEVPAGGFWQVHKGAPDLLARVVSELVAPRPADHVLDLYAGAGLLGGALAPHVAAVTCVESAPRAAAVARRNLPAATVVCDRVDRWLRRTAPLADVVVLDPPRRGAGAAVVRALVATRARVVCYVACDPAALARDLATFGQLGWRLDVLRAFDLFPMTAHVECVATLVPV